MGQINSFTDLTDLIKSHQIIAVDTCCFIYLIESSKYPIFAPIVQELFEQIRDGRVKAITSPITITEIMSLPRKLGFEKIAYDYKLLITNFPNLSIPEIDITVADKAAFLRSTYGMKTPDALQLATAIENNATAFITFDKDFKRMPSLINVVIVSGS